MSTNTLFLMLPTCPLGPLSTLGTKTLSTALASSPSEDTNAHLQHLLELYDTIVIKDVAPTSIKLHLFPFSLAGKVKQWFYKKMEVVNTWAKCSTVFLAKFFPMSKTNALRGRISNF